MHTCRTQCPNFTLLYAEKTTTTKQYAVTTNILSTHTSEGIVLFGGGLTVGYY